jgi:hypothetical protein
MAAAGPTGRIMMVVVVLTGRIVPIVRGQSVMAILAVPFVVAARVLAHTRAR